MGDLIAALVIGCVLGGVVGYAVRKKPMATLRIVIDVTGAPSSEIVFAPAAALVLDENGHYDTAVGDLPAGFLLGALTTEPPGWGGDMTAEVAPAGSVSLIATGQGAYDMRVGAGGFPAGVSYSIELTATP